VSQPTKADLGDAIRRVLLTEEGRTLVRSIIRPVFEPSPTNPDDALASAGRRNLALTYWSLVVTHCPTSIGPLLVDTDGLSDDGGRGRHDRGRTAPGRAPAGRGDEGPAPHHGPDDGPADTGD
jgi:hypothetical protein